MNQELTTALSRMQNLEIALWILIGILFVGFMLVILYVIPTILQAKRTLNEAEQAMKTVNTDILPKVNNILDESGPVIKSTLASLTNAIQTTQAVISGVASITQYIPVLLSPVFRKVFTTIFNIGKSLFDRNKKGGKK